MLNRVSTRCRLRQVDVKAEHFERQVQRAEQERDAMERKYEVRTEPLTLIPDPLNPLSTTRRVHDRCTCSSSHSRHYLYRKRWRNTAPRKPSSTSLSPPWTRFPNRIASPPSYLTPHHPPSPRALHVQFTPPNILPSIRLSPDRNLPRLISLYIAYVAFSSRFSPNYLLTPTIPLVTYSLRFPFSPSSAGVVG